jgi:hypothetical protein
LDLKDGNTVRAVKAKQAEREKTNLKHSVIEKAESREGRLGEIESELSLAAENQNAQYQREERQRRGLQRAVVLNQDLNCLICRRVVATNGEGVSFLRI